MVFITKPGKANYSLPENFRPISLTSFLLKTLEKLIDKYIRDAPLKIHKIHKNQYAYQRGKSTLNALHNLVSNVELSLSINEYAVACLIDISGAFNNITYRAIKRACCKFGLDPGIAGWIEAMLLNRIIFVHFGTSTIAVTVTKGSPQGGVLSPILWCLVINELLTILNEQGYQTEGFSDDLATLVRGKYVTVLCELLQTILNIVCKWCDENELSINPNKTQMIIFHRKRKIEGVKIPRIKGIEIRLVEVVKYLGIILDYRLYWIANLDARLQKATIALWQCRKAYSKSWGLSPKVMLWIYTTIIRPMLMYGSFLWNHICKLKYVREKLTKFQRMACKAISGAWKSTPTAALEAMLNLPPLHLFIESEAIATLDRLATENRIKDTVHSRIWLKTIEEDPTFNMPTDKIIPAFRFEKNYNIHFPSREDWLNGVLPPKHGTVWYTDGSLIEKAAGAGLYSANPSVEISISLGTNSSIYLAEVRAILECAYVNLDQNKFGEEIYICTDSQAALKALSSFKFTSALTVEAYEGLNKLAQLNKVDLLWVPGHSGVDGNERADALARKGALSTPIGAEPIIGTPYSSIRKKIKIIRETAFNNHWDNIPSCRQAKNCISIRMKNSKYLINLSRTRLKIYTGVVTGHFDFNKHLTNIGKRTDPGCDLCGYHTDTAEHYLCYCPAFITKRRKFLGGYTVKYNLIKHLHPQNILHYIGSTGRFG